MTEIRILTVGVFAIFLVVVLRARPEDLPAIMESFAEIVKAIAQR